MQALSQLSYGPWVVAQCSAELVLLGPVDAEPLVVTRRGETQLNDSMIIL